MIGRLGKYFLTAMSRTSKSENEFAVQGRRGRSYQAEKKKKKSYAKIWEYGKRLVKIPLTRASGRC